MMHGMTTPAEVEEALRCVGRLNDAAIDLAEAALMLAAFDRPGASVDAYRDHLGRLAVESAEATRGAPSLADQFDAVNAVLFERHGYQGDSESYDDMQNANLMRVIDRRKGLPVAAGTGRTLTGTPSKPMSHHTITGDFRPHSQLEVLYVRRACKAAIRFRQRTISQGPGAGRRNQMGNVG